MGKLLKNWMAGVSLIGSIVTMLTRLSGRGPGPAWVWDLVAYVTLGVAFLLVLREQRRKHRQDTEKQRTETEKYKTVAISEYVNYIDGWYKSKTHKQRPFGSDEQILNGLLSETTRDSVVLREAFPLWRKRAEETANQLDKHWNA